MTREDEAWRDDAACRPVGPAFFNLPVHEARTKACNICPVRGTCLAYALVKGLKHGVWGGVSERERFKMLKKSYPYDKLVKKLTGADPALLEQARLIVRRR